MAYHHHHHHAPPPAAAAPSCNCCCSPTQTHHLLAPPPPPQPAQLDPLLVDAVVSRLLYLHSYRTPINTPPRHPFPHYRPLGKYPDFSSLVDRIEALEASLHRSLSTRSVVTVRDTAAHVIQQRFRAFLARRSRILRQLQDLAVVKSSYATLRSSVSNSSRVRFEHFSRKVEDLLLQLDSIEAKEDDPMISEGKGSIGRNLDGFLRYVDGRSNEVPPSRSNRGRGTVSNGKKDNLRFQVQRDMVNDLRDRVERIQKMSRALEKEERADDAELKGLNDFSDVEEEKGGVSVIGGARSLSNGVKFAGNGNAYKVISNSDEQSWIEGEDDSGDDSVEGLEKFKKVEVKDSPKDEEEGQEDSVGSYSDGSDGGMPGRCQRKEARSGIKGEHRGQNAGYVFTAPVPEKMESVAVTKKKKKEMML